MFYMINNIPPYIIYILVSVIAAAACSLSIPKLIILAKLKKLYDRPDNERKIHTEVVPNLGGVSIFFSSVIIASLFVGTELGVWKYIVAATMILFVIGIKDDLISLTPSKKFAAQILAAFITVYFADIRLESLHGIFGIYELSGWYSYAFSIIGCIFVTNAFNLIDGIDGLAGSISVLCTFVLGICLALQGNHNVAIVAFTLMGAIVGFLKHNLAPAKIFMGDAGSLFIGFMISILCISFINSFHPEQTIGSVIHTPSSALLLALSVLFIPVFDSFRVIISRLVDGRYPFKADRTHLHHLLLDLGFSHTRIVTILIIANLLIISVSLMVQDYDPNLGIMTVLALAFGLFGILYIMRRSQLAKTEVQKSGTRERTINYANPTVRVNGAKVDLEPSIRTIAHEGS